MLPSNLPTLLREAGLEVVVEPGWRTRSRPGSFGPVGVLNHHTGASARGWTLVKERAYAQWMFLRGRPDLPAPLCQIALGRSGTVYLGAAGRANHAGTALPSGSVAGGDGNRLYIGIEWMLSGYEAIPDVMMDAGITLNAVLTEAVTGNSVKTISSHYQTSVTGKWDIGDPNGIDFKGHKVLDMTLFRKRVAARIKEKKAEAKPTNRVVALSWNVKVNRKPAKVRREIVSLIKSNNRPAIVALQEVRGYRKQVKALSLALRYRVHQPADLGPKVKGIEGRESGQTAILVRRSNKVRETGAIRCTQTWEGPHGRVREGRVLPWVIARVNGKWTLVVSVHMPTGGQDKNKAAWDEALGRIETLAAQKDLPFLMLGDWNTSHARKGARTPRGLARRLGGRVAATNAAIDYALVKGHPFKATRAAKRGSDHPAIRLVRK